MVDSGAQSCVRVGTLSFRQRLKTQGGNPRATACGRVHRGSVPEIDEPRELPRRLVLEFDRVDPPAGRVCGDGDQGAPFFGWAGLAGVIDCWLRQGG